MSRHHNAHYTASSGRSGGGGGGGGELEDEKKKKTLVKCTEQQGLGRRGVLGWKHLLSRVSGVVHDR